ncbi:MAG: SlyX family protein [Burkholderiaceae bacterium]
MDDDATDDTDRRLMALEIKASYTEDLIDHLNDAIVRQQALIDALVQELRALRAQMPGDQPGMARSLRDELPPHY